jgi:hypothetical protein
MTWLPNVQVGGSAAHLSRAHAHLTLIASSASCAQRVAVPVAWLETSGGIGDAVCWPTPARQDMAEAHADARAAQDAEKFRTAVYGAIFIAELSLYGERCPHAVGN